MQALNILDFRMHCLPGFHRSRMGSQKTLPLATEEKKRNTCP
jgi:hypothetical protein